MTTITTRAGKGSPLTNAEVDANFSNLNTDKYQAGDSPDFVDTLTDKLSLDTAATPGVLTAGEMAWNVDEGTADLGLNGGDVILQIGQETHYRVVNKTGSTITNGALCMYDGTIGASGQIRVKPWIGGSDPLLIMGIATADILNDARGYVTTFGKIRKINTTGTPYGETWLDGDILYAGPSGGLTKVRPAAPNTKSVIAAVVKAHASVGELLVRVTLSSSIENDDEVELTSITDKDVLQWNATNSRFENKSFAAAGLQATLVSGTNIKTINSTSLLGSGDIAIVGAVPYGLFRKADPTIVAWTKTGAFTVSTATTLYIEVNGEIKTIASSTAVTMPGSATNGTDYAIWAKTDGTLEATSNHTSPPVANSRKVGGFHYAPGGHSGAPGGGNTTAQINAYSMWDLKWRPACPDPRGMTLVANSFWADIYLCGVDHYTNGTSKFNVTHADGSSPPKIPAAFGGNGSTAYSNGNWWNFAEIMRSWGKRLPTYSEFAALAYGTTEASSVGTDQGSSVLNAAYTSKWGVIQASGVLWTWGDEFGGGAAGVSWTANTDGRGSTYQMENAVRFGGNWGNGSNAGSRCSNWSNSPTFSSDDIGGRGVCDHLLLD